MTKKEAKERAKDILDELHYINEKLKDLQVESDDFNAEVTYAMDELDAYERENELFDWLDGLHSCLNEVWEIDIDDTITQLEDYIKD